jgi:flagellar biosynthesis/type III secretory pathway protein FliH
LYENLESLIQQFEGVKTELYRANEEMLIRLIASIGKQVILKELKTDVDYIKRLSLALIERVGAKEFVKISIPREQFTQLEELREFLKRERPEITNLQIEAVEDLSQGGCKVETDLAKINASIDVQMRGIEQALGGT